MINDKNKYKNTRKTMIFSIVIVILLLLTNITIGDISINLQKNMIPEPTEFDDCESDEVIVNSIISPPSRGMTGIYDITASFTSVEIIMNGIMDYDQNEPWIKHEESPDNNNTPQLEFYTSCDEEFMYIAFENETGKILSGEIFVDKNMNGIWDGPIDDTLFNINSSGSNSDKVKDNNGNPIINSIVEWGDQSFVEVKIPKTNWSDCQEWAYIISSSTYCTFPPDCKNPSWGNESHPSNTPPDNEFLSFTCSYGYGCYCGVAFKALVDIYEIIPGECEIIYETDFENLSDNIDEWEAISLDENPDTWNLSENRSKSSSRSFHCTKNEKYYGNAIDILQMKDLIDTSDANNITLSFWHWCEGDTYTSNSNIIIADYGDIEIYAYIDSSWTWISLSDLGISNLYYDNNWIQTKIVIEKSNSYPLNGENITGEELLSNGVKFRFVWTSTPQFQYEGWYIDDIEVEICKDNWYDLIWQSQSLPPNHWCIPFGVTEEMTFPIQWNVEKEGEYLISVCTQEEPPWCGSSCIEKKVIIGNIHDVAVISLEAPCNIDSGEDLPIETIVKNVGTYNETNVQVKATIKKEEDGTTIWQETTTISTLNISEEVTLNFIWEDAIYCDHILEVRAILPEDEIPENNSKSKNVLVATNIFEDNMNDDCNWTHADLTGGEGHWNICTSGYDKYFWCGIQELTIYGNNWNDVAMINNSLNLSLYDDIILTFDTYFRINESDYGYVEISKDGGKHWEYVNTSEEYTGLSSWVTKNYNLTEYKSNNFKLRFRFYSNNSLTERGWIIDNVTIKGDGIIIFNDDFGSGTDKWIIERLKAGDWWQRTEKEKDGDTNNMAWWCGDEMSGKYPANLNNILTLNGPCMDEIDFSKVFDADMIFMTWYNISEVDIGFVEISDDNGGNWDILESFNGISGSDEPEWTTKNYALSAVDPQPGSGVKSTYYRLNGGGQQEYTSQIPLQDGEHNIEYWSVDNAGNEESHKTAIYKIDTNPPTVQITRPEKGIYWRDIKLWPIFNFTLFTWLKTYIIRDITIEVDANDPSPGSGINKVEFFIDGTSKENITAPGPYVWNWDERAFLTKTIMVTAYDNAGHDASDSIEVVIFNLNLLGGS